MNLVDCFVKRLFLFLFVCLFVSRQSFRNSAGVLFAPDPFDWGTARRWLILVARTAQRSAASLPAPRAAALRSTSRSAVRSCIRPRRRNSADSRRRICVKSESNRVNIHLRMSLEPDQRTWRQRGKSRGRK